MVILQVNINSLTDAIDVVLFEVLDVNNDLLAWQMLLEIANKQKQHFYLSLSQSWFVRPYRKSFSDSTPEH